MLVYWFLTLLLLFIQLICVAALGASCFPGVLTDTFTLWTLLALFGLTLLVLLAVFLIILIGFTVVKWIAKQKRQRLRPGRYPRQMAIATCGTVLVTLVLLTLNLPRLIAFSLSRSAFDAFVTNTEQLERLCNDPYSDQSIAQQLGLYTVSACDRDPRGGIYLQTYGASFMVTEAYGFAYQPNPQGSRRFSSSQPEDYQYGRVIGDWYWFMGRRDSFS